MTLLQATPNIFSNSSWASSAELPPSPAPTWPTQPPNIRIVAEGFCVLVNSQIALVDATRFEADLQGHLEARLVEQWDGGKNALLIERVWLVLAQGRA